MGDSKFRDAKPAPAPSDEPVKVKDETADPVGVISDETEPPIVYYEEIRGVPYSAEFFQVKGIWDSPDLTLRDDIETIEDYYKEKVRDGEYEDGIKSFEAMIKEGEKATDTKLASKNVKISKIAEFFRFMMRTKRADRIRRTHDI